MCLLYRVYQKFWSLSSKSAQLAHLKSLTMDLSCAIASDFQVSEIYGNFMKFQLCERVENLKFWSLSSKSGQLADLKSLGGFNGFTFLSKKEPARITPQRS